MNEKPILFSGEMVRAILEGRKTQTRRVVKPQPHKDANVCLLRDGVLQTYEDRASGRRHIFEEGQGVKCPYGRPGDLLWVRETWATTEVWDNVKPSNLPIKGVPIWYCDDDFDEYKKRPSIFMPRWASRITLRVTDVRVERIQDISEADAVAEGLESFTYNYGRNVSTARMYRVSGDEGGYPTAREAFENLWDSINARRGYGWDVNPWVWVVTFEVQP